jgi:integrase/recombinase XerD
MKLRDAIEGFIDHKRSNGLRYRNEGTHLRLFGKLLGDIDLNEIGATEVLAFLNRSQVSTYTWRRKFGQFESFFKYWHQHGEVPTIQMPPPRGFVRPTFAPHVYSRSEVRALLQATNQVQQRADASVHSETLRTLLLFVYGTGARAVEVFALLNGDIDLENRTMRLRLNGTGTCRTLPIGSDLRRILNRYSRWKRSMKLEGEFFLVRKDGSQLNRDAVYCLFHKLLLHAGVVRRDRAPHRPRIHDFRPTFAVHLITSWIRRGKDLNRLLPALSGYLGQKDLNAAERFLALTPDRFKKELDKLSPLQGERWAANPEIMTFLSRL